MFGQKAALLKGLQNQVRAQSEIIRTDADTIKSLRADNQRLRNSGLTATPEYYNRYMEEKNRTALLTGEIQRLDSQLKEAKAWRYGEQAKANRQELLTQFAQQLMLTRFGMTATEALEESALIYPEAK